MAADQIAFATPKDTIKEGSQLVATVKFRNRDTAAAVTPTNIRYRLDCLTSGVEISGWTSIAAASAVTITVTPTQNAIQQQGNCKERKQLTVSADKGLATEFNESFEYDVVNLRGTP